LRDRFARIAFVAFLFPEPGKNKNWRRTEVKRVCNWTAKSVVILLIASIAVGAWNIPFANGEETRKGVTRLEDIHVGAAKMETSIEKLPTNVTVITREEIENAPGATNVNELLQRVPGLWVPQYQSGVANDGQYSSRGSEVSTWGVRFLVNGIEFNKGNGYTNPPRIPLNDIERIEIIKTPSAEYGDQAVGGVINVVTRVSKKPIEVKAGFAFGDFDFQKYYTVLNGSKGKWEYFADFSISRSAGYQDDTMYEPNSIYTRVAYKPNDTMSFEFHGSHMDSQGQWPITLTQAEFDDDPTQSPGKAQPFENDYNLGALVFKKRFGDDDLEIKLTGKDEWVKMNFGFDSDGSEWEIIPAISYTLRHQIGSMRNAILFGAEYRYHEMVNQRYTMVNGQRVNKFRDTLREDKSFAGFIMDELSVTDALTISFGARYDSFEQEQTGRVDPANSCGQSNTAISPKFGITYSFNGAANLFAGYNTGFKSPARLPGSSYSGGLEPEKVVAYEVGLRGRPTPWLRYSVAGFLSQYQDKWLKTGAGPNDPYINAGETEAKGIELSLGLAFANGFYSDLNYTYQESKYKDFLDKGVRYDDKWIPNVPEQMLGLVVGYRHPVAGQLNVTADYVGERYFNKDNTLKGADYWILGAGYKKTFDQWQPEISVFLSAKNLLDEKAVVYGSGTVGNESLRPVYGRSIMGGVEFLF
jgi:iron complex outermembrane receptor protein